MAARRSGHPNDPEQVQEVTEIEPLLPRHDPVPPEPLVRRSLWEVVMYAVFSVAGAVLLGFFVKRWIDAGNVNFDLNKALKSALGGGLSGAAVMVIQVLTLMPLRTIMNYQYRYGTSMSQATKTLYADGGWTRYYQGLAMTLVQGPVSRFGDTFANAGILALLHSNPYFKNMGSPFKTVFASLAAAAFRMILTPIDTVKTTLQTQGKAGTRILRTRVRLRLPSPSLAQSQFQIKMYGIGSLWYGAFATTAATFAGHYPWFTTFSYLDHTVPQPDTLLQKLFRRAFIKFCASITSDTVSNSLRVVKTYRQVNETRIGYFDAARAVVATDGLIGLFGRGLKTRILTNLLQELMFTVLWNFF
ncbi:Mitochondrial carrier [Mycena venus]|uniref:Mitochondrial carrier n=1 Tax=Mycena venus TaxID=2733690 RepID=A0A8H6WT21_9AGAR|nr:Mitochondrial carrier [Mycena venus]